MGRIITESGINFIADNTFHIEKSGLYLSLGEGIRSVEFVRVKDGKLLFIEAKTSFADPNNPSLKNVENFKSGINEICEKFIHSLNMFLSIKVGVAEQAFNSDFAPPESISLEFILVIKNHELKWCRRVREKLWSDLPKHIIKIWKPTIHVINEEVAFRWKLIDRESH